MRRFVAAAAAASAPTGVLVAARPMSKTSSILEKSSRLLDGYEPSEAHVGKLGDSGDMFYDPYNEKNMRLEAQDGQQPLVTGGDLGDNVKPRAPPTLQDIEEEKSMIDQDYEMGKVRYGGEVPKAADDPHDDRAPFEFYGEEDMEKMFEKDPEMARKFGMSPDLKDEMPVDDWLRLQQEIRRDDRAAKARGRYSKDNPKIDKEELLKLTEEVEQANADGFASPDPKVAASADIQFVMGQRQELLDRLWNVTVHDPFSPEAIERFGRPWTREEWKAEERRVAELRSEKRKIKRQQYLEQYDLNGDGKLDSTGSPIDDDGGTGVSLIGQDLNKNVEDVGASGVPNAALDGVDENLQRHWMKKPLNAEVAAQRKLRHRNIANPRYVFQEKLMGMSKGIEAAEMAQDRVKVSQQEALAEDSDDLDSEGERSADSPAGAADNKENEQETAKDVPEDGKKPTAGLATMTQEEYYAWTAEKEKHHPELEAPTLSAMRLATHVEQKHHMEVDIYEDPRTVPAEVYGGIIQRNMRGAPILDKTFDLSSRPLYGGGGLTPMNRAVASFRDEIAAGLEERFELEFDDIFNEGLFETAVPPARNATSGGVAVDANGEIKAAPAASGSESKTNATGVALLEKVSQQDLDQIVADTTLAQLLTKFPALINDVSTGKASPLHMAAMTPHGQYAVPFLIRHGADVEALDYTLFTPLARMAAYNRVYGLMALLEAGAHFRGVQGHPGNPASMNGDVVAIESDEALDADARRANMTKEDWLGTLLSGEPLNTGLDSPSKDGIVTGPYGPVAHTGVFDQQGSMGIPDAQAAMRVGMNDPYTEELGFHERDTLQNNLRSGQGEVDSDWDDQDDRPKYCFSGHEMPDGSCIRPIDRKESAERELPPPPLALAFQTASKGTIWGLRRWHSATVGGIKMQRVAGGLPEQPDLVPEYQVDKDYPLTSGRDDPYRWKDPKDIPYEEDFEPSPVVWKNGRRIQYNLDGTETELDPPPKDLTPEHVDDHTKRTRWMLPYPKLSYVNSKWNYWKLEPKQRRPIAFLPTNIARIRIFTPGFVPEIGLPVLRDVSRGPRMGKPIGGRLGLKEQATLGLGILQANTTDDPASFSRVFDVESTTKELLVRMNQTNEHFLVDKIEEEGQNRTDHYAREREHFMIRGGIEVGDQDYSDPKLALVNVIGSGSLPTDTPDSTTENVDYTEYFADTTDGVNADLASIVGDFVPRPPEEFPLGLHVHARREGLARFEAEVGWLRDSGGALDQDLDHNTDPRNTWFEKERTPQEIEMQRQTGKRKIQPYMYYNRIDGNWWIHCASGEPCWKAVGPPHAPPANGWELILLETKLLEWNAEWLLFQIDQKMMHFPQPRLASFRKAATTATEVPKPPLGSELAKQADSVLDGVLPAPWEQRLSTVREYRSLLGRRPGDG